SKLNTTGSNLSYSTYFFGAASNDYGIAVDGQGNAYITSEAGSTNFPTTVNAFQRTNHGSSDAFVSKFDTTGSALIYSTYLGGSDQESSYGIAVDEQGNAYVTGRTYS